MLAIIIITIHVTNITWLKMGYTEGTLPMVLDTKISVGATDEPNL